MSVFDGWNWPVLKRDEQFHAKIYRVIRAEISFLTMHDVPRDGTCLWIFKELGTSKNLLFKELIEKSSLLPSCFIWIEPTARVCKRGRCYGHELICTLREVSSGGKSSLNATEWLVLKMFTFGHALHQYTVAWSNAFNPSLSRLTRAIDAIPCAAQASFPVTSTLAQAVTARRTGARQFRNMFFNGMDVTVRYKYWI